MSTELFNIAENDVLDIYAAGASFDVVVSDAREVVASFRHDMSTASSRKKTASLAAHVARLKVRLDNYGKGVISDQQKQINAVNGIRKKMRDDLGALKKEARAPLDDWQAAEDKRLTTIAAFIGTIRRLSDPDDGVNYFSLDQLIDNFSALENFVIGDSFAEFKNKAESATRPSATNALSAKPPRKRPAKPSRRLNRKSTN